MLQGSRFFPSLAASRTNQSSSIAKAPGFDLSRVGELLRGAREKKGLSLGDVSQTLFLTKSTVKAIESGQWGELPDPVYVKGYAKSYASALDIGKRVEELLRLPSNVPPREETVDASGPARWAGSPRRETRGIGRPSGVSLKALGLLCIAISLKRFVLP